MDKITRKELKSDKFAQEVGHTVDFFEQHRDKVFLYGGIALGIIALILGYGLFSRHQHGVREQALYKAIETAGRARLGSRKPGCRAFPPRIARDQQAIKLFSDVASSYSGSAEGRYRRVLPGFHPGSARQVCGRRKAFCQRSREREREIRVAGEALAGAVVLLGRQSGPGRKDDARSDGAPDDLRFEGSGGHRAGAAAHCLEPGRGA